jgi:WhiB family redox-sensing transcriptional regulator
MARASNVSRAWVRHAACRGLTGLFFAPPLERPGARQRREDAAAELCASCPVRTPCRTWARDHGEYGFWGGESEEDRAAGGYGRPRVGVGFGRIGQPMRAAEGR